MSEDSYNNPFGELSDEKIESNFYQAAESLQIKNI